MEKNAINKYVAYLILDKNKNLVDASASAIQMLDIDLHKIARMKARFDIQQHLSSLFGQNAYQYINKAGSQIDYAYPVFESAAIRISMREDSL